MIRNKLILKNNEIESFGVRNGLQKGFKKIYDNF